MNWSFPREQTLFLRVHSASVEKRVQALRLLKKFSPNYHEAFIPANQEAKTIHIVECYLSGWDYFVLKPELQKVGRIYVNETN